MTPKPAKRARKSSKTRKTKANGDFYDLRLYVAGQTGRSLAALANLQKICDEHLEGRYRIKVIDLLERPRLARGDQIVALPTLVRKLPEPIRKLVGDLSDIERALVGLDLRPRAPTKS
jgi:circadian clock protein KaiB